MSISLAVRSASVNEVVTVALPVDGFPHANPLLLDNTITDNEAGFEGGGLTWSKVPVR